MKTDITIDDVLETYGIDRIKTASNLMGFDLDTVMGQELGAGPKTGDYAECAMITYLCQCFYLNDEQDLERNPDIPEEAKEVYRDLSQIQHDMMSHN